MSSLDPKAVESAARHVWNAYADSPLDAEAMPGEPTDYREYADLPEALQARCRSYARSAIYAYLSATSSAASERIAVLEGALRPFAESLVARTDVEHHSQDWRDETDDTVVSIQTSHQRKGMPDLSPDHTLWVGAFRAARAALKGEAS